MLIYSLSLTPIFPKIKNKCSQKGSIWRLVWYSNQLKPFVILFMLFLLGILNFLLAFTFLSFLFNGIQPRNLFNTRLNNERLSLLFERGRSSEP